MVVDRVGIAHPTGDVSPFGTLAMCEKKETACGGCYFDVDSRQKHAGMTRGAG